MKYRTVKKAYEINLGSIEEGYLYPQMITYADNINKAKVQLLKDSYCENICLEGEEEEVTYITIPVIRCKEADKLDFEGKEMSLCQIEDEIEERRRNYVLDEILNNKHIKYCYIIKGGYYRPNYCGYTEYVHKAGVYDKEDAVRHAKGCKDIRLERIDIDEHNKAIEEEIKDLKTRILKTK